MVDDECQVLIFQAGGFPLFGIGNATAGGTTRLGRSELPIRLPDAMCGVSPAIAPLLFIVMLVTALNFSLSFALDPP